MSRENGSARRAATDDRPAHPRGQAVLLLVVVTVLIIALAALSSWGTI